VFDSGTVAPPSPPVRANFTRQPFGGTFAYTGTVGFDLRFLGQMLQAESGLFYNWNRQYDSSIARYTQPHPPGLVDGPSRYAYVGSDPLQKVDPSGQIGISGFTKHGLDQFINRCVGPSRIIDAINNPLRIVVRDDDSTQYRGAGATVVINTESCEVVTCWRK
jgi:RHS repeat-associated protein